MCRCLLTSLIQITFLLQILSRFTAACALLVVVVVVVDGSEGGTFDS